MACHTPLPPLLSSHLDFGLGVICAHAVGGHGRSFADPGRQPPGHYPTQTNPSCYHGTVASCFSVVISPYPPSSAPCLSTASSRFCRVAPDQSRLGVIAPLADVGLGVGRGHAVSGHVVRSPTLGASSPGIISNKEALSVVLPLFAVSFLVYHGTHKTASRVKLSHHLIGLCCRLGAP